MGRLGVSRDKKVKFWRRFNMIWCSTWILIELWLGSSAIIEKRSCTFFYIVSLGFCYLILGQIITKNRWEITVHYAKWFKRFIHHLYIKMHFPEPGIHVQTIINMKFKSRSDKCAVEKLFRKYEATRIAALDQMKSQISDMGLGMWEERTDEEDLSRGEEDERD
jgi:hypothetical protein